MDERATVAVVLSGAGARGAFQAGALAEIVPALHARGQMPTIWLGTSAGSVNAALWAGALHLGPHEAAERVLDRWRTTSDDDVFRPIPLTAPWAALQYTTGFVLGVGTGTTSLLDTAPLRARTREAFPTDQIAANLRDGVVAAVGAVATRMPTDAESAVGSGRSVLFLDEHEPSSYDGDATRALDVVRGPLHAEHVLRVVVVSATGTSFGPAPEPDPASRTRDVADAAAQVLTAVLADHTIEDLLTLRRLNRLVAAAESQGVALPRAREGSYRQVPSLVVSPRPGEMGRLAARVHAERTGGLSGLREVDNRLIGRFIRGAGDGVGRRELLSYLFFDPEYFARSIDLGREHARAALAQGWHE